MPELSVQMGVSLQKAVNQIGEVLTTVIRTQVVIFCPASGKANSACAAMAVS
jgi:hypothetical protein